MNTNKRKKIAAFGIGLTLIGATAIGTASASLTNAYKVETTNKVYTDTDLTLLKTPNSQVIDKDITPGQPASSFVIEVQNTGTLNANWAFYVENADQIELPDVALDNTKVKVASPSGWSYDTTLRGFIENATVSNASQDGDKIISAGNVRRLVITITPDSSGAAWTEADFGSFSMNFDTAFLASQVVGGSSDLMAYTLANGTKAIDDPTGSYSIYTVPASEVVAASQG